ncbi:MAG: hypothetical protein QOG88_1601, partial [Actinomycetota bacterium]|nr:hypothetical protein [Actinomycetota bacterium]
RDARMSWVPHQMWLTFIDVNARAADVTHDLSIDASGYGRPDPIAAGYAAPERLASTSVMPTIIVILAMLSVGAVLFESRRRRHLPTP